MDKVVTPVIVTMTRSLLVKRIIAGDNMSLSSSLVVVSLGRELTRIR